MIFKDFEEQINQEPAEPVTITYDDFQAKDSWKMKKHCDKNILEILREPHIEQDLSAIHNNGMAAGPHGKFEKKVGEDAPPSIYELVNIVKFLQYLKKVPENSTFVIVSAKEKIFIATFR